MAEFKKQTFQLSNGKQIKLHGNSFFINRSLEIGEGFVPNVFSLFEESSDGKPSFSVSNPHKLTPEELHELADYNIRLWMDLKDSIRSKTQGRFSEKYILCQNGIRKIPPRMQHRKGPGRFLNK
jgi:hypothetical protein